ncbi:MAG: L,D-transpeptidase family protein [Campylobacterota bacterium]|nr:L,D-transpeptidase family protein [Campylobacterota bacterium]
MKKIIMFFMLILSFVHGSNFDIVNIYRTSGLKEIERQIQHQLQTQSYWDYYLRNIDTSNGYYESIQYLMICQKDLKDMVLYDTKNQKKIFYSSVFTGKANGDKKIEGDMKTPVGAYKLTRRLTKLDPFYGPLALTTNYPNIYDKAQGKTGHGIWIHGLPTSQSRDDYTKGCIALDNKKIKKLDNSISINNSILIISEKAFFKTSKADISLILAKLFQWKSAWKYSDFKQYISFYDKKFKKADGKNLKQFKRYKKRIFNKKERKTIKFSNINIVPYPNETNKKLYKIVFDELYKTRSYRFNGKKELYVEIKNNNIYILTES